MFSTTNNDGRSELWWYVLPCLLLLPALLINLHLQALIADEPIRALVGLEMIFSDQYFTPTLNGEFYYNKPPLFNWILVGMFNATGSMEEWVVRIPTVVSLLVFVLLIFLFFRKYVSNKVAYLTAFFTLVSGRILFYDSFLGLIDTLFSLVIFILFFSAFHFNLKRKYAAFFVILYLLTAVAFMLKGIPALVFLVITIFVVLWRSDQLKQLFSVWHFIGIGLFIILIGSYYYEYSLNNGLDSVFTTLWSESSKRTVVETSFLTSLLHVSTFPFQQLYHFLPFTLLVVLLIRKKRWKVYYRNEFLQQTFWIMFANIIVYWLSPETRPRYLFMFLPFIFVWLAYALEEVSKYRGIEIIWIEKILLYLQFVLPVLIIIPLFVKDLHIDYLVLKVVIMFASALVLLWLSWKFNNRRVIIMITTLLLVRIGFDLFIFPYRAEYGEDQEYKMYGVRAGQLTKDCKLFIAPHVHLDYALTFYITREHDKKVRVLRQALKPGECCVVLAKDLKKLKYPFTLVYKFITIYERTPLCIVRRTL